MTTTMTRAALAAVVAIWAPAAVAEGQEPLLEKLPLVGPQPDTYSAFEADGPAKQVHPDRKGVVVAPRSYSSLPLQLEFEGAKDEDALPYRSIPESVQPAAMVSRAYKVGDCEFELTTGEVSVSTHQLANNQFYTVDDSVMRGATLHKDVDDYVFLSVTTDLRARLTGDEPSRKACVARLKREPLYLGKASLAGTQVAARGEKHQVLAFRKSSEAKERSIYLTAEGTGNKVLVRDEAGVTTMLESQVFAAKGTSAGYYDLEVKPDFLLRGGVSVSARGDVHRHTH
jgi:hypothetical protein